MGRGLPEETVAEIIRLYQRERLSRRDVGERMHVSESVVSRVMQRAGLRMRPRGGQNHLRLPHAEFRRTAELYLSGLSEKQVGDALGVTREAVHWRLAYAGVPRRTRPEASRLRLGGARPGGAAGRAGEAHPGAKLSDAEAAEIREAYAAGGVTQRELAARYGVSPSQVHNIASGKSRAGALVRE